MAGIALNGEKPFSTIGLFNKSPVTKFVSTYLPVRNAKVVKLNQRILKEGNLEAANAILQPKIP